MQSDSIADQNQKQKMMVNKMHVNFKYFKVPPVEFITIPNKLSRWMERDFIDLRASLSAVTTLVLI